MKNLGVAAKGKVEITYGTTAINISKTKKERNGKKKRNKKTDKEKQTS